MNITKDDLKDIIKNSIKEALKDTPKQACLTISECAKYSNIGEERIRELVAKENTDFPFFKVGVKVLVSKTLLDDWLMKIATENRQL